MLPWCAFLPSRLMLGDSLLDPLLFGCGQRLPLGIQLLFQLLIGSRCHLPPLVPHLLHALATLGNRELAPIGTMYLFHVEDSFLRGEAAPHVSSRR
jgi:hypothetical protein